MLGKFILKGAKLRFALWAVGQALPQPSVLKPYVNKALLAVVAAAACGMLATLSAVLAVLGVYFYSIKMTGDFYPAIWIASAASLLFALTTLLLAQNSARDCLNIHTPLKLYSGKAQNVLEDAWNTSLSGFLDGLLTEPAERQPTATKVDAVAAEVEPGKPQPRATIHSIEEGMDPLFDGNATARVMH